jgi:hypothetical protein
MDQSGNIDSAVAEIYEVVRRVGVEDLVEIPRIRVPVVTTEPEMVFAFLDMEERADFEAWAKKLDRTDARLSRLKPAAELLGDLAKRPEYVRPSDGWEIVAAIAIAAHSFDFETNATFGIEAIQRRVRARLLRDEMVERTIWGIFGLWVDTPVRVGESSWLLGATTERRTHVARPLQPIYPLIHTHAYLMTDREVVAEKLRTGARDPLPVALLACLRATMRADALTFGPTFETSVITPSSFAGFTTMRQLPNLPLGYSAPSADVQATQERADEAVALHRLIETDLPKQAKALKPYLRSLDLAVERLTLAVSRDATRDTILDLMIALETLLTTHDEKTEITYRIAMRGAQLSIGGTAEARVETKRMLSNAYGLRSEVVHGATLDPKIVPATISDLRAFVARVIRLSAHALTAGTLLIDQIETAMHGDRGPLTATLALL